MVSEEPPPRMLSLPVPPRMLELAYWLLVRALRSTVSLPPLTDGLPMMESVPSAVVDS
jgi:hypothetical protein